MNQLYICVYIYIYTHTHTQQILTSFKKKKKKKLQTQKHPNEFLPIKGTLAQWYSDLPHCTCLSFIKIH